MHDGLNIKFREMIPEEGLLSLARSEILSLHDSWPERLQCNIVIANANRQSGQVEFDAVVELELGAGVFPVTGNAISSSPYAALRTAFSALRSLLPPFSQAS